MKPSKTDEHYDHVFPMTKDMEWRVRAYHFSDPETARKEWERIEEESLGKGNFSIWRTMMPGEEGHYIVLCGRLERLPAVVGGALYELDSRSAKNFAMRRFRVSSESFAEHPEAERFDQQMRYGEEHPMIIDTAGGVKPYRQR